MERSTHDCTAHVKTEVEVLSLSKEHLAQVLDRLPTFELKKEFNAACRKRLQWREHHLSSVLSKA